MTAKAGSSPEYFKTLDHFSPAEIEARVNQALDKIKTRLGDASYLPGELKNNDATITQPDCASQAEITR